MAENWEQFGIIMRSLTGLNWHQVKFLEAVSGDLVADVPPQVYVEQGQILARDYLIYVGPLDDKSTAAPPYSDVLTAVNAFSPVQLYALHIVCKAIFEKNPHIRARDRAPISGPYSNPQNRRKGDPGVDSIEWRISNLMRRMRRIYNVDRPQALAYLEQAIQLAKENGLPYAYLEAIRVSVVESDRSELYFAYFHDLDYYRANGNLRRTCDALPGLARECYRQGKKRKAMYFAKQARNTLTAMIDSEKPVAEYPQYEAYARIMLRIQRAHLNRDIREKKFR